MFRRFDVCIWLFLVLNALYWVAVSALNTCAQGYFYLVVPALFIVPAALYMNYVSMSIVVVFSAMASFSNADVNPFLIAAVWLMAAWLVNVSLLVNMFLILCYAVILPCGVYTAGEYVKRILVDAAASGLFILAVGNFCAKLPVCIMDYFGIDITMNEEI